MPLTLPNGVRFTIHGEWGANRPILTVWHAIVTTSVGRQLACLDAAGAIGSMWGTHVCPMLANNYTCSSVGWLDLNSEDGSSGDFALTTPVTGGVVGTSLSPYDGVVVTKTIADKGRGRRSGRVFVPGGTVGAVNEDGEVSALAQGNAETALTAFMVAVNAYTSGNVNGMHLVVGHTPHVLEVKEVKRRVPATDGLMSASTITGFTSGTLTSGIRRRISG